MGIFMTMTSSPGRSSRTSSITRHGSNIFDFICLAAMCIFVEAAVHMNLIAKEVVFVSNLVSPVHHFPCRVRDVWLESALLKLLLISLVLRLPYLVVPPLIPSFQGLNISLNSGSFAGDGRLA
jgi:hypothetical protein